MEHRDHPGAILRAPPARPGAARNIILPKLTPRPRPAARPPRNPRPAPSREARLRIAVDFDGVLFDHVPYVLRGFRDAHGIDLEDEGLRHWDFFQYRAVRERHLTWQCVRSVLERIDTDPLLHELPPRDDHARDIMRAWRAMGHEVNIVTAREEAARTTTEKFLRQNAIPHDALVMEARIKTGYDVLIDDAPHNVLTAAAAGSVALLMDQPYNRDVPCGRNPHRIAGFQDAAAHVDAIAVPPTVAA